MLLCFCPFKVKINDNNVRKESCMGGETVIVMYVMLIYMPHHTTLKNSAIFKPFKPEDNHFLGLLLYDHVLMSHRLNLSLLAIIQAFLSNAAQVLVVLCGSLLKKIKNTDSAQMVALLEL